MQSAITKSHTAKVINSVFSHLCIFKFMKARRIFDALMREPNKNANKPVNIYLNIDGSVHFAVGIKKKVQKVFNE